MKCRKIYEDINHYSIIFFNSKGLTFPLQMKIEIDNFTCNDNIIDMASKPEEYNTEITYTMSFIEKIELNPRTITIEVIKNLNSTNLSNSELKISTDYDVSITPYINPKDNFIKLYNIDLTTEEDYSMPFNNYAVAIKDADNEIEANYADKQEGVAYSLTQRISILKGELWWMINYGLPVFEKVRNKAIFDSVLINIILKHPDVRNIISINSFVDDHTYTFDVKINSIFNETITISNKIMA